MSSSFVPLDARNALYDQNHNNFSSNMFQSKERSLQDQNNSLQKQLKEKEKQQVEESTQQEQEEGLAPNTSRFTQPTLTIGGGGVQHPTGDEEDGNQTRPTDSYVAIPPWLLGQMKI